MPDKKQSNAAKNIPNPRWCRPTTSTSSLNSTSKDVGKPSKNPIQNANLTMLNETEVSSLQYNAEVKTAMNELAYGELLRSMLLETLVDEKIEKEKTEVDVQLCALAERFENGIRVLDETSERLKKISFVSEHQRLLDLKNSDCSKFSDMMDKTNMEGMLKNINEKETKYLDRLETKNVDFGYNNESGYKQLLDAVNEAISGFRDIKNQSNFNLEKLKGYTNTQKLLGDLEVSSKSCDQAIKEFEEKFPNISEKVLIDISEKISKLPEKTEKRGD